jgi:hypothetical protein
MSMLRCAVALAASAAIVFLSARMASCDEGSAKQAPGASEKLAWDEPPLDGPRMAGVPRFVDDFPPPGPPRDGDRDRPPPRNRDGRGEADRQPPPGGPRDGDRDRQRPPERDGRPGPDGPRQPGPPRDGDRGGPVGFGPPAGRQGVGGPGQQGMPRGPQPDWESLQKNDPDMFKLVKEDMELDHATRELAMRCRQAPKEQSAEMKKQLQQVVEKQFEVRQERRNLELKRLDTEIQRLREAIERRTKARDKIVEQRLSDLLGIEGELSF